MKEEMLKALKCLYLAVQEDIANDVETKVMNYVKHLEERCEGFATNLYRVRKERNELRKEIEDDNTELDTAWSKVVEYTEAAEKIKGLIDIQKQNGNYNCNEFMYGMLIGLETAYYSLLGEEAKFTDHPEKWLKDGIPKDFVPTVAEGCQHWRCHIVQNEAGDRDLICSDCDAFIEKLDTSP